MLLSVGGMFLLVFGIQEGESYDWGTIAGPITVWGMIGAGVLVLTGFVLWQRHLKADALLPLSLFHSRNFSLANVAGASVTFGLTGIFFPLTLFLQTVLDLSPLNAALVGLPGSLVSGIVAPFAGRLSDRIAAKWVVATGFLLVSVSVFLLAIAIEPDAAIWQLVLPMTLFGVGTGALFSPLASLATSGLDQRTAGAGAGAFNTTRQIGGVIGSAVIVALLTWRLSVTIPAAARDQAANLPEAARQPFIDGFAQAGGSFASGSGGITLPDSVPADVAAQIQQAATAAVHSGFATAVTQSILATVAVLLVGFVASVAMKGGRTHHAAAGAGRTGPRRGLRRLTEVTYNERPGSRTGEPGLSSCDAVSAVGGSCSARREPSPAAPR